MRRNNLAIVWTSIHHHASPFYVYRNLLASLSDSSRHRMSSTLTVMYCQHCVLKKDLLTRTWSLHVPDDASACVVHEFNSDLGNTTSRACSHSH